MSLIRYFVAVNMLWASPVLAQDCSLCASKIVVAPTTAPCLAKALAEVKDDGMPVKTFDLSGCKSSKEQRGVVQGLPTLQSSTARPTVMFLVQTSKISCLKDRFTAVQDSLDPSAQINLSDCP